MLYIILNLCNQKILWSFIYCIAIIIKYIYVIYRQKYIIK